MRLLLLLLLVHYVYTSGFWKSKSCTVSKQFCDCSGSNNKYSRGGVKDVVHSMRLNFQNCTRVLGNVEITDLKMPKGSTIDFFDDVREIKGYLLIHNVDVETILFPQLQTIWGDLLLDNASFLVTENTRLKRIVMPKLSSVRAGEVRIRDNGYLCNMRDRIDYTQFMRDGADRLNVDFSMIDCPRRPRCHMNCTEPYCWGPSKDACQKIVNCPQCSNGCFDREDSSKGCCHDTCEGGCTGPSAKDCVACKEKAILHGDGTQECVHSCPKRMDFNRVTGTLEIRPDGYFVHDRYCVKRCPEHMLVQDDHCVRFCSDGFAENILIGNRVCERCQGACPKRCIVDGELTRSMLLGELRDCERIDGAIDLKRHMFSCDDMGDECIREKDLNVLKSVKYVSDYVSISLVNYSPVNLSFLENLEVIQGRKLADQRYGLLIFRNDNLRELRLRSLRSVKNGRAHVASNQNLCLAESLDWTRIVHPHNDNGTIAAKNNAEKNCKTCSLTCEKAGGCWGSGDDQCFECAAYTLGQRCVDKCPERGFFTDQSTRVCGECEPECLTCTAPGHDSCTSCRNFIQHEKNSTSTTCVAACSEGHYRNGSRCLPCHESCYHGCTGPSDRLGDGGCSETCDYAVVRNDHFSADYTVERCLYAPGSMNTICEDNRLHDHFEGIHKMAGVEKMYCEKCHDECVSCTKLGVSSDLHGCVCRNYKHIAYNSTAKRNWNCVESCPVGTHEVLKKAGDEVGVCEDCNPLCDPFFGCSGPSHTECGRCLNASLTIDGVTECFSACPESHKYNTGDAERSCSEIDVRAQRERRKNFFIALIVAVCIIVALIIAIVCYRCNHYKTKYTKEKVENAPIIPEIIPMDPTVKPNMSRINVVTTEELDINNGKILGKGAFGIVYQGYYFPKGQGKKIKLPVAIKVVKQCNENIGAQQEILDEAVKMCRLQHKNLTRLLGICSCADGIQMVTPIRPHGSLLSFLKKHKQHLSGRNLILYCYQISSAMKYLHENRVVHRDLAARNVLVKSIDQVEVTDFGLSKILDKGSDTMKVGGRVPVKWLAPESLEMQMYSYASDVWSFGITCWEILTFGESPYRGISVDQITMLKHLRNGNLLEQPNNCTTDLYSEILKCWMMNPDSRPTFVMLAEKFEMFCKSPHLFVVDHEQMSSGGLPGQSQLEMLHELLDEGDFTNPSEYFDEPPTPTSTSFSTNSHPRRVNRLESTNSHRYQTDPLARSWLTDTIEEVGMEENNYLVPNSRNSEHPDHPEGAIMYTPIVHNDGTTELQASDEYYNDVKGQYYNDSQPSTSSQYVNDEASEKESCV